MGATHNKNAAWGRAGQRNTLTYSAGSLGFILICPIFIIALSIILYEFQGSIIEFLRAAADGRLAQILPAYEIRISDKAVAAYAFWVLFQAALFQYLPGKDSVGQQTAGGNLLKYRTNGLQAWFVTHITFGLLCWFGVLDPAFIPKNWMELLHVASAAGLILSALAFVKAYLAPSHERDRKFSGSAMYDFYMGIEHNPRIGEMFDFKLYVVGRIGMMSWTIIDISNAAYQYQTYGSLSPSIVLITILHGIYVIDFFVYEDWYLRTIDIAHDHFGFYLAWGSTAWLPSMYTLQAQYLGKFPTTTSVQYTAVTFAIGLFGYYIFRTSNNQKDRVRSSNGECTVWGSSPRYIRAKYTTADGKLHESILLCSGWWGWSRHANYVGDILISFAMCALVGTTKPLVWFYGVYMTILLIHRSYRDHKRCRDKYGKQWDEYCRAVPWRFVPGIW